MFRLSLFAVWTLSAFATLHAQVASSSLLGVITDPATGGISEVRITAHHTATGFTRSTLTGTAGQYRIDDLIPGAYTVTAEKSGFRTATTNSITLEVNQKARLDLQLELGAARDSVIVSAAASPVETDDASIGYVLHSATILSLPLETRNVASLITLGPGAIPRQMGGFTNDVVSDYQGSRGLVQLNPPVNGARSTMNTYLLDGAVNTDRNTFAMAINPPLEGVQEFRIQSSQASAEFSQAAGAVVDVVTKSGGKKYHGSGFEYFRNEGTDARNFFDDPALPRPIFRQNQFGGSVGGALPVPNTFFFATYEGMRGKSAKSSLSLVPDAASRGGDFTGGSPIFDPMSPGAPGVRLPFPNNSIPKNRLDPIAQKYLQQYEPLPNRTGGSNYLDATPNQTTDDLASGRIDHQFRNQNRIFGRYTLNEQRDRVNSSFPLRPADEDVRAQQAAIGFTSNGAAWLNEARLSFTRLRVFDVPQSALGANVAADLGIQGVSNDPLTFGLPYFLITNYSTLTDDPAIPKAQRDNLWSLSDGVSLVRGAHTLKAGFQFLHSQVNFLKDQYQRGQFIFTGAFTSNPASPDGTGDALADFLLGFPQDTNRQLGNTQAYLRQNISAAYFQDDWRVNSRLTVNLGLRYEYAAPYTEASNNLLNLDYSALPAAPRLVRVSSAVHPDRKDFAPRVGLAWRPKGSFLEHRSTVLRAGYGIYYSPETAVETYSLVLNGALNQSITTDGTTPRLTLANGFTGQTDALFPTYFGLDPNAKTPYIQQWQAGIQQELPGRILLELSYLGTKGTRLGRFRNNNTPLHTVDGENLAPRPGDLQSLREFPTLGPITQREHLSNSIYHSLQVKAEKRLSSRLTFLGSFVWSKSIDDSDDAIPGLFESFGAQDERNLHLERGLSFFNVGRRVSVSAVYRLPSGQFLKPVLGNWQLSTVITLQDGTPVNPVYFAADFANTGTPNRPNIVPGQSITLPRSQRTADQFFNPNAFSTPAPFTFGNAGRDTIIGPGNNVFDISAQKRIPAGEGRAVDFRAEFYNAFNHPNWGIPGPYPDFGPFFGKIFSTGPPRRAQFALRFEF